MIEFKKVYRVMYTKIKAGTRNDHLHLKTAKEGFNTYQKAFDFAQANPYKGQKGTVFFAEN